MLPILSMSFVLELCYYLHGYCHFSEKRKKKETCLVGGEGEGKGKERSYNFIVFEIAVGAVVQQHPLPSADAGVAECP